MKYIYQGIELELNDNIVKAYKAATEKEINDLIIELALENYPQEQLTSDKIVESVHNEIALEIQIIGLDYFKNFGIEMIKKDNNEGFAWKNI